MKWLTLKRSNILKNQQFGLQLDKSSLPGNETLLGYVHFIKRKLCKNCLQRNMKQTPKVNSFLL